MIYINPFNFKIISGKDPNKLQSYNYGVSQRRTIGQGMYKDIPLSKLSQEELEYIMLNVPSLMEAARAENRKRGGRVGYKKEEP